MRAIDDELKFNIMARPNLNEKNDSGDQDPISEGVYPLKMDRCA